MIIYVDLEHDRLQQKPKKWRKSLARRLTHKYRLEEISGDLCLIVRYHKVSPALVRELNARAVVVSGCYTDYIHYSDESLAGLRAIYRQAAWPVLGFCAGCQLMAQAYGAELGPIGQLPPHTPDPHPELFKPGMQKERGFMPVDIHTPHPLFDGLGQQPVVFQSHYWEVKSVPDGFKPLAQSKLCKVQALAHTQLPLFGLQFHPEEYDDNHPAGRRIIENFFKIIANQAMGNRP